MSEQEVICAVVLHFRTPDATVACISSLIAGGICDVVMVDNSADNGRSRQLMDDALERLRPNGLRLRVIDRGRNLGFAVGVDVALAEICTVGAAHALLINSDAKLHPGAIEAMKQRLRPGGCVVPTIRHGGETVLASHLNHYHPWLALYLRRQWPGSLPYPSGSCLLLHRDLVRADLLDSAFFFYGEDVYLGHRLRQEGWVLDCCDAAVVEHVGAASARVGSMFYEYHMVRGHWLLAGRLSERLAACAAMVALRVLTLPLRATLRSLRGRSLRPWRALALATWDVCRRRRRDFTPPVI